MRSNRARRSAVETASVLLVFMILSGLAYTHFNAPKHFQKHDSAGIFVDW